MISPKLMFCSLVGLPAWWLWMAIPNASDGGKSWSLAALETEAMLVEAPIEPGESAIPQLAHNTHDGHAHDTAPQTGTDLRAAVQANSADQNMPGALDFVPNQGQWPEEVRFSTAVTGGRLFLEGNALTWHFVDAASLQHAHENPSPVPANLRGHAFRARFLGANEEAAGEGAGARSQTMNFFRGQDPSLWASKVPVYAEARLQALYPGIDLRAYAEGSTFKYDLELAAGVDPAVIALHYEGLESLALVDGDLELTTSVNRLLELAPYAWQEGPAGRETVPCRYALNGDTLRFEFPEGYDPERALVIDPPTLIFGSYSGSMSDNWGYTATYDDDGALYGGGISFGSNYPTTLGAYNTSWSGGVGSWPCDIAISKFSPDGSTLEYSTFLGGTGNDLPHSMICTPSGELWLYGTTGSADFPVTPGCVDPTFNGGYPVTVTNVIVFPTGTDMFATKISADGASLVGSTYLGGTNNDGLNLSSATGYNYGDHARGEIIVDRNGNAYIASTTLSNDFPITAGAIQTSFGGSQDGLIVKLNDDLTNLEFSTFLGGTQVDAAYSMKLGGLGGLVVGGGTTSPDFPVTPGAYQTSYQGGLADGWIARINTAGTSLLTSSYIGTADYDQVYFVETDADRDVYITGQSIGGFPVSPGTYSNPGSSQFLAKMDFNMSTFEYSTVFGSGINRVNIRPTAMLVDKCENVYISGWGGLTNSSHNPNVANTFGLPITGDATQSSTDGSDFYFIVFERDATDLLYATFFGGNISREHVDGGTSRFDNEGIIYQAVCAGCGGHDDFPTTPGVWSNTNNSSNCNLGVIKYQFDFEEIEAAGTAFPTNIGCINLPVTFQNQSQNAVDYFWDFGDGSTSTAFEPFHLYTDTGVYNVMLVAIDSTKCIPADTAYLTITALVPIDTTYNTEVICQGQSAFLGGAFQTTSGVYTDVYVSQFGCDSTVLTTLEVLTTFYDTANAYVCTGDSVSFFGTWISTAGSYTQNFGTTGGCDSSFTLNLFVNTEAYDYTTERVCDGDSAFLGGAWQSSPGSFVDTVFVAGGCDTIRVTTLQLIRFDRTDSVDVCLGDSLFAGGSWQNSPGTFVDSLASGEGCDSVVTTVITILQPDSVDASLEVCDGDSVFLGGAWQDSAGVYVDVLTNVAGCDSVVTTTVDLLPVPYAYDTVSVCPGDPILVNTGPGGGTYVDTFSAANGCDSLVEYWVIALNASSGIDSLVICAGDSVFLDGWQNSAGTYNNTLVAANGCDSVVSVSLSVLDTVVQISTIDICDGDSVLLFGQWEGSAGLYTDTFMAANGCDSIIGFDVIVRPAGEYTQPIFICGGDSVFAGGAWQQAPGVFVDSFTSAYGCDSIVRSILDTLPRQWVRVDVGICPGDSIQLGGSWYSGPGSYTNPLVSAAGCDSVVYGDVFVIPITTTNLSTSICLGDSMLLGGDWQNTAGVYLDTVVSSQGCDSILRTTLSVLPTASSFPTAGICNGDSTFFGGQWLTASGTYVDTLPAANGCDSVVTLELNVGADLLTTRNVTLCSGDSVFAGGAWQNAAGTYYDSLLASAGCDSVVATMVQVDVPIRDTSFVAICLGDSFYAAGAWQSIPGTYTTFGSTALGCDSFQTVVLSVNFPTTANLVQEICTGDSAFISGGWQQLAGLYTDSLIGANGCDSVVRTTLYVRPSYVLVVDTSICFGDDIFLAGAFQNTTGIYRDTFMTASGCDSILRTNLTVRPVNASSRTVSICAGDSLFAGGAWQFSSGTYLDVLTSAFGCDSTVQTNLVVLPRSTRTETVVLCPGDSVFAGSHGWIAAAGLYRDTLIAANGCDSIVRYQVSLGSASTDTTAVSICAGDAWFAGGAWQTAAGTYVDTFGSSSACDSVVVTELTVVPANIMNVVVDLCASDSVFAGGGWQTTAGFYVDVFVASTGCDSVVVTQVNIIPQTILIRNRQVCAGDSLLIAGVWQNTSGVYDAVFAGANGCDSIVRTTLTVVDPVYASRTVQLCPGDFTVIGGVFVSSAGVYQDTVPAFSGCDSILTITVVVQSILRDTVLASICDGDSLFAGGAWQNTAGIYDDTYTASGGCDSIVSTVLDIFPSSNQAIDMALCFGDSVLLGESPTAFWTDTPGTYAVVFTGTNGCDSNVTYSVQTLPLAQDSQQVSICEGDGYFAGGAFQTTAGFYADTLVSANGCDSILITELLVSPSYADTLLVSTCLGDSMFVGGAWQTSPGLYTDSYTTAAGCDSIVTTELQFLPDALATETLIICEGDSAFLGGAWQTLAGDYVDTIFSSGLCDTILTTTLQTLTVVNSQTLWLCEGDSMFVGGAWQDSTGLFADTLINSLGCDSIVFTTLLSSPRESYYVERVLCADDSLFLAGAWQTTAGLYVDTFSNTLGCDSIMQTQLSFTPYYFTFDTLTICEGDSIPGVPRPSSGWSGSTGFAFGGSPTGAMRRDGSVSYVDTLVASGGCDSLVQYTIIEVPHSIGYTELTLCAGDSIRLGGAWVNTPGFYFDTLVNAGGCDSILTVNLSVVDTFQTYFSAEICAGDSFWVGSAWASVSGVYSDTLTATTGCDSILYVDLIVHPSPLDTVPVQLCEGDSVLVLGQWVSGPATLDDSLTTSFGCDSVVRYVVDTVPVLRNWINVPICDGDSAFVAGIWTSTPGNYSQSFAGAGACDSIVTWRVMVNPVYVTGINTTLCAGDSVFAGGAWQFTAGVYSDVLTTIDGCDSTVVTTVSMLSASGSAQTATVCTGDSAYFQGNWYTTPGTYSVVLPAANGCDSTLSFTLNTVTGFNVALTREACSGDSVFAGGAFQTSSGVYTDSLTSSGGCDSVVTTSVIIHNAYSTTNSAAICGGDSIFLAGAWRTVPGLYTAFGSTVNGCDSTVSTVLSLLPASSSLTAYVLCPGDSVFAGGAWQSVSGTYTDILSAANGCDSVATTQLFIEPIIQDTVQVAICEGTAHYAGGGWQTDAGIYSDTSIAPGGCLQVLTTVLAVNASPVANVPVTVCAGDSVFAGGAWQFASGTYTDVYNTVAGCDSTINTVLTVLAPIASTRETGICEGDSVFAGGAWQSNPGSYVDTFVAASGCDSVVTTTLDIAPVYIGQIDVDLCEGDVFSWQGDSVVLGGEFFLVLNSAAGCDSVIIYDVSFQNLVRTEETRSICEGDSTEIFGQWVSEAGLYADTLIAAGLCPEIRTVDLSLRPRIPLTAPDTLLCLGDSVQLSAIGGTDWTWFPADLVSCTDCADPWVYPTSTTVFTVSTTDECATNPMAEALVEVYPPPVVEAGDDMVLAPGQSITLSAEGDGNGPLLYWWEADGQRLCTDCPEYTVAPQAGMVYTVWVEDGLGCKASDRILANVDNSCVDGRFHPANALSPNGDGHNDEFVIRYTGPMTVDLVRIYNRWGEMLYETTDPEVHWDGTFRGKLVDPGVYVYYLEGLCEEDRTFFYVGNVTLIR